MNTTTRNTHQLQPGDIIRHHGMRLEVPAAGMTEAPHHHVAGVRFASCRILNVAEVDAAGVLPRSWRGDDGNHWQVQGNQLAHWAVEVPETCPTVDCAEFGCAGPGGWTHAPATWERITAGDVQVGDRISRSRNEPAQLVSGIRPGASAVYLVLPNGHRIRPRLTAKLWRQVGTEVSA
jgi:hypothetical protein